MPFIIRVLVPVIPTAMISIPIINSTIPKKIDTNTELAIVATAKEILVIIWYMLTRRELYRYMNKERYERKLSRIKKIKESAA
jgi:hypothetical protein